MPGLKRTISVALDMAGCPNRCRHCYLGAGPNGHLSTDVLREVADAFWGWSRPDDDGPFFEQVYVSSWYREPDYSDDYRQLYELERELSRAEPRRYELLSIWRLARDPAYAAWAREVGPRACQITFFGLEATTDHFYRRPGAFRDALAATERLLEVGMVPRWQVFLTRPGLADLPALMDLARDLRLRERVADLRAEFVVFCHPPGPSGEGWHIRHLGITEADLAAVPPGLMDSTIKHFGGRVDWVTEAEALRRLEAGDVIEPYIPEEPWFFVDAALDVYTNYAAEIAPAWRLGNFRSDGLDAVLRTFEQDATPGLSTAFHTPFLDLGRRRADPANPHLYALADIPYIWIRRHVDGNVAQSS